MKTMKRLASAALALVMTLCLAAPAFAAGETASITIDKAPYGQEYKAYRLFDLESYGGEGSNEENAPHSYKVNANWAGFVAEGAPGAAYVNVDDQGYVTWKDGADVKALAKAAMDWAVEKSVKADAVTVTEAAPEGTEAEATTTASFGELVLGYYLVSSTVGSLCALDTTNTTVTITEKNKKPVIVKEEVKKADENQPSVGDSKDYKVTITAQPGAEAYVMHDAMGKGLSFNNDVAVAGVDAANYTVVTDGLTDGCTFHLVFAQSYLDTITEETQIVVTYSATITAEALTVDTVNNVAHMDYGENNHTVETKPSTTDSELFEFNLAKTSSVASGNQILTGAEFALYTTAEAGEAVSLVFVEDEVNGSYYRPAEAGETGTTVIAAGIATIKGLGEGSYYLEETKQPSGYNKLNERVLVEVGPEKSLGKVETNEVDGKTVYLSGGLRVENLTGAELPSTGGIGTTIFYITGGALALGAGILLVTKKRMGAEEED